MTASARLQGIAAATFRNRALAALTCTAFDCWLSSVAVAKVGVPVCVGVLTCMCMCMCMCVCVCVCMYACMHASKQACMCVCIYAGPQNRRGVSAHGKRFVSRGARGPVLLLAGRQNKDD